MHNWILSLAFAWHLNYASLSFMCSLSLWQSWRLTETSKTWTNHTQRLFPLLSCTDCVVFDSQKGTLTFTLSKYTRQPVFPTEWLCTFGRIRTDCPLLKWPHMAVCILNERPYILSGHSYTRATHLTKGCVWNTAWQHTYNDWTTSQTLWEEQLLCTLPKPTLVKLAPFISNNIYT